MSKYLIVLPCYGSPYILCELKKSDDALKPLQEVVQGNIEPYKNKKILRIHPMFAERPSWALAEKILHHPNSTLYVNENGSSDCCPNMATVITEKRMRTGGCPHLFGDCALVISVEQFNKRGWDKNTFIPLEAQIAAEEEEEDEEEEDEEEEEEGEEQTLEQMTLADEDMYIITLNDYLYPYIYSEIKKGENALKPLQEVVGGNIEPYNNKKILRIHPTLVENPSWALAEKILYHPKSTLYVNENGSSECPPNTSLRITDEKRVEMLGGCPHPFGVCALVISVGEFNKRGWDKNTFIPLEAQVATLFAGLD